MAPRLMLAGTVALISGLMGEVYAAIFYTAGGAEYFQGFRTGASIGFLVALFETFYIRSMRRSWIGRLSFVPSLILRVLIITLIVRLCLVGNEFLTQLFKGEPFGMGRDMGGEFRDTVLSLAMILVFVIVLQISSLVGLKRFHHLLVGRYFRPVEEERIFLFVDLKDSTKIARKLGDIRFHEFLSEFFYQVDRAIVKFGGEIVSYVGDAVIVTWPLHRKREKNAACLKTVKFMHAQIDAHRDYFMREFDMVPQFRAALNGGAVVVGECGDSRRQVTFIGDVVNITSRIELACKEQGVDCLASHELISRLSLPDDIKISEYGKVQLKGAPAPQLLYTVDFGQ